MIMGSHSSPNHPAVPVPVGHPFATPDSGAPLLAHSSPQACETRASEAALRAPLALRTTQNWVLSPLQDSLFIIAAPLLVMAVALVMFRVFGAAQATAYIILAHVVMTVAHHLPTFIRIYGDVELFRRFERSFVLAPVLSLVFTLTVLCYINVKGYPLEYFLYIYIMLALWDPWHFLRQHYGFMRIYDRKNAAPARLAARMDLWLCVTWFAFILLASGDWLPGVLEDLQSHAQLGVLLAIPVGSLPHVTGLLYDLAVAMSAVYALYVGWCWRRGYFISGAKLALFAITFGAMYVAYTPNAWILGVAPEWTFKVGFAVLGIVHMTQYLAIVWRYNRSLASRAGRARAGLFRAFHARGTWVTAAVYVAVCLAYGSAITTVHEDRWLMSALLAIGFTSTLMHYYFDGFIWKVRHSENRENLSFEGAAASVRDATLDQTGRVDAAAPRCADSVTSWWNTRRSTPRLAVFLRQLVFFGVPATILTAGAVSVWGRDTISYIDHMYNAHALDRDGRASAAGDEARLAFESMQRQLPAARKLAEIQPTASREAALAFLVYNHVRYEQLVIPSLAGEPDTAERRARYLEGVEEAIAVMEEALTRGGPLHHAGRESLTPDDVRRTLTGWRGIAQQLRNGLAT